MAEQEVWIGSMGPFLYDDEDTYEDDNTNYQGLRTTGGIISVDGIYLTLQVVNVGTSPYELAQDELIYVDAKDGDITINLPLSASNSSNKLYYLKKTDFSRNVVEIVPQGSELIDDMSKLVLHKPKQQVTLTTDNNNWRLV